MMTFYVLKLTNDICINTEISRLMIILGLFINIVKILIPLLLIFMGIKDFYNATLNPENTAITNAAKTFKNRLIAGITIFFIPTIVSYSISLIPNSKESENIILSCTNCLFNSSKCSENITLIKKEEENKKDNLPNNQQHQQEQPEEEPNNNSETTDNNQSSSNGPTITNISKDGVIITVNAKKKESDITGYYFNYQNQLPNKETGGYIATSQETIDLVRLVGTTYVWVEDANGQISEPQTININSNEILITANKNYTILKGTALSTYLTNQGWSIEELNKLMARSVRAAGLYTKEAVATSALSLTHTLAQKYKIKIPYQSAGIHKVPGAKDKWGAPNSSAEASNEQYYGLDCSAFVNWVYANAGFGINSRVYYWGSSVPRIEYSETNGDIGDVLVYGVGNQSGRHVRLIIGKTDTEFIIAEASSSGVAITTQKFTKSGDYQIQKSDYLIDVNKNTDYYLNTNYPTGY